MAETGIAPDILADRRVGRRHAPALASTGALTMLSASQAANLIGEWRDLAVRCAENNVYFHPGVLLPAIQHLNPEISIATVHDGSQLIGLAPIEPERLGRIAPGRRVWVHDYGPLGVPLLDGKAINWAASAFVEDTPGASSLMIPCLPTDGQAAAAFRRAADQAGRPLAMVGEYARAICERSPAVGHIRSTLPTRRRKEYARQMRRLADLGTVTSEIAVDPDRVRARFEEFLALEAAGWKGDRDTALASQSATSAFARDMIFNRSERGTTRIVSLRLGDHPLAIVVCFIAGSTAFTWKIAYDEAFARFSPGAQVMLEAADALFEDPAITRIDSCACANHPMIDRLWRGRMNLATAVIGPVGGGLLYRAGLAAMRAEIEARATARHLRTHLNRLHKNRKSNDASH